jgi:hypothetical protein
VFELFENIGECTCNRRAKAVALEVDEGKNENQYKRK